MDYPIQEIIKKIEERIEFVSLGISKFGLSECVNAASIFMKEIVNKESFNEIYDDFPSYIFRLSKDTENKTMYLTVLKSGPEGTDIVWKEFYKNGVFK